MSQDDLADRLVRTGAAVADIAEQLGDDVSTFPSLVAPTAERFITAGGSVYPWSFCEHTDVGDVPPLVLLNSGTLSKAGIAVGQTAGAAITYDVELNGTSVGSVTLPSGDDSATAVLTATAFVEGDVLTVSTVSVPDAVSPGRHGVINVLAE